MPLLVHIALIITSFITLWYVIRKIRKSQMQISDSIFWICFTAFIFILGAIPPLVSAVASHIGFDSPANFVFLVIIFILLIKCFSQSLQISQLDSKLKFLVQRIARENHVLPSENERSIT